MPFMSRLTVLDWSRHAFYHNHGAFLRDTSGPTEVLYRIDAREEVDPADYYFRINPLFETASPKYEWLNSIVLSV